MLCLPEKHGVALIQLLNTMAGGWIVNLPNRECSCLKWQDLRLPCAHAWCAQQYFKTDPAVLDYPVGFGGSIYTAEAYTLCYIPSLRPILLDDLTPDGTTLPPEPIKHAGRPCKKRLPRDRVKARIKKLSRQTSTKSVVPAKSNSELDPIQVSDNSVVDTSSSEALTD
jgi:hypothetical protein